MDNKTIEKKIAIENRKMNIYHTELNKVHLCAIMLSVFMMKRPYLCSLTFGYREGG